MKKYKFVLLAAGILIVGLLLFASTHFGCPVDEYSLKISGYPPEFTFLSKPKLSTGLTNQLGVKISSIRVYELDSKYNYVRTVWSIDQQSNPKRSEPLKLLKYGVTPPGWTQQNEALTIQDGIHYRLNSDYYFMKSPDGNYQVFPSDQLSTFSHQ